MRKRYLAVLFAVLPIESTFAQSNVTLYGLIDAGVSYVSNQGGHSVTKFDDGIYAPNLFGLSGSEDLGGGTKAIFKLESQFQVGTGALLQQGLFGRNAYVGLENARFGTVSLGNIYDFMFTSLTEAGNAPGFFSGGLYNFAAGPFQKLNLPQNPTGWFDWSRTTGMALSNSIRYQSPVFAGLSAGALYAPGGVAGSFGSNSAMSFGLNYVAGPFGLGAAYTQKKYPGSTGGSPQIPVWNWGVGAHYVLGPVYTVADFVSVRNSFSGAAAYAGQVGASWQIAPAWSLGASYMYMKGNDVLDNNHANQFGATLNYSLSKRTMVYAEGVFQRANSGAQAAINGIMDPAESSSSATQAIARVGLHTTF
ncbi:porin [Paraburkholderia sp. HP33-1]|uniref:porin n=1 Tax=Paraburkholderia sp. HP33-1 TaxID=2883243 RepID=UPI001F2F76C2|nr:porin [Paraburkholderia sp. HP33-1]